MLYILIQNYVALILILGLTLQVITGNLFEKEIEQSFKKILSLLFFLVIFDVIDYYLASKQTVNNFRYISSILGYVLRPSIMVLYTTILLRNQKKYRWLWIPIIIEFILLLSTPFTHWVFYFDQNNIFHRNFLGYLPHFLGLFYVAVLITLAKRMNTFIDKTELLTLFYMVGIIVLSTILETTLVLKFLFPTTMTIACIIYYIYLYVQIYKKDALTGLLNRRNFYIDSKKMSNSSFFVISIDLNGLKTINDTKGHAEGDIAINTVAHTISAYSKKNFRAYRVGGDEFMTLCFEKNETKINQYVQEIRAKLAETEYSASFGIAQYHPGDNFDKVCYNADAKMYEDKKKHKKGCE